MSIEQIIRSDIKQHMKSGDTVARDILRLVLGEMQLKQALGNVTEADEIKIINKTIKNNNETLSLISDVDKEQQINKENLILQKYLPEVLNEDETRSYVESLNLDFSVIKGGARVGAVKRAVTKSSKSLDNAILIKVLSEIK